MVVRTRLYVTLYVHCLPRLACVHKAYKSYVAVEEEILVQVLQFVVL